MSCSDVTGTEMVEVFLAILEVILVLYKNAVEILLTKTKPLIVGIIYRPPNQSNFLEIINANFDKLKSHISMVILI